VVSLLLALRAKDLPHTLGGPRAKTGPQRTLKAISLADVIIIGGGPAGSCAATRCATRGLHVILLERERFPRDRPGESLHPGFESLLEQLGVLEAVVAAGFLRFDGNWVECKGATSFEAFKPTRAGSARGLQAWRPEFDAILLARARHMGVEIVQPSRALRPIVTGSRVTGVETDGGKLESAFVIDAAGRGNWLARHLNLEIRTRSPRLIAHFAYMEGECPPRDDNPGFFVDKTGWTWTARVRPGLYNWTRLNVEDNAIDQSFTPEEFRSLRPVGRVQTADVTWRLVPECAGDGYFLCGDAAAVLDPTSSHGVVKAIMSGAHAADQIVQIIQRGADAREAAAAFRQLFSTWFEHDVTRLKKQHARWYGAPR
jgi:flavin-dependent dehydrogenase